MSVRSILSRRDGAAAAEFVLLLPVLILLLFGSLEAGHFIWTQHKLVEAVRNGARFASRVEINDVCNGPVQKDTATIEANIRRVTRTGQLANADARPLVRGWTDDQVSVDFDCAAFVASGIYEDNTYRDPATGKDVVAAGPLVTVTASRVRYPLLFGRLIIADPDVRMRATAHAAVIGV